MKLSTKISIVTAAALVTAAGATLLAPGARQAVAQPATAKAPETSAAGYGVDGAHSSVIFKIKHMGVSNFYGAFKDVSGSFSLADTASIDVTVKADSVDSRIGKRDDHIKSPDFFNVKEFPTITFKAASLKKGADGNYSGKGDLTFRGVTKAVELVVTPTGTAKGRDGKPIAGFETRVNIKRSDFGNSSMIGPLSDEVEIIVALEGAGK